MGLYRQTFRQRSWLIQGALGAILINVALFGVLPGMIHMERSKGDLESLNVVTFDRIKPEAPKPMPLEKEEVKQEKAKPKELDKIVHHESMQVPRTQLKITMPQMDLNMDPRLSNNGIPMVAPVNDLKPSAPAVGSADGVDFSGVMEQGGVDVVPVPKFKAPPQYPYRAKRMGREGTVKVRFKVDKGGNVSDITILDASPPGFFEEAVLTAVSSWKYAPGELMGKQVAVWVTTSVTFKLE